MGVVMIVRGSNVMGLCRGMLLVVLLPLLALAEAPTGRDCISLDGRLVPGGLVHARVAPGTAVTLDGQALDVTDDGLVLFGLGRDAKPSFELSLAGPVSCTRRVNIGPREYNIQRVEGVPQRTVTPDPADLERIARERELVRRAKVRNIQRPDLLAAAVAGFQWPAIGPVSL